MSEPHDQVKSALEQLSVRFAEADAAQITVAVSATLASGLTTRVQMRKHAMTIDEPKSFGGDDLGPNPVQLALASLASCQVITYRMWAAKLDIALEGVQIEVDGDVDLRGYLGLDESVRAGVSQVRIRVRLDGPETPERYRELADAVDRHCPVLDFTGSAIPFERTLDF